ncbi:MAG: hypothetical protein ACOX7R_07945 [Acetivibrionales bacterium]
MSNSKADKYKILENVANGIYAACKIQDTYKSRLQRNSEAAVIQDNISTLNQMLQILADYSPEMHRNKLGEAISKSSQFSSAYRNLKKHFISARNQRMNKDLIIKAISTVKPIVDNRRKAALDKALRINEILNS